MANKVILIDTSILIDYYRRTDKEKSAWINLVRQGYSFAISVVTKFEIYAGATENQLIFWDGVFQALKILHVDEDLVDTAVQINTELKRKRKQIDLADLFIASAALVNNLPLVTLNKKHFERIDTLQLL